MGSNETAARIAPFLRLGLLVLALGGTQARATMQEVSPVKIYVFGAQAVAASAGDTGAAESVADLQRVVSEKLSKTMRLVPTRDEADIAIEVIERKREVFRRSVRMRVHHRGGPTSLYRFSTSGGFAFLAEETVKVLNAWGQQFYKAVVGLEPSDILRQMPPDIFFEKEDLRSTATTTRANAVVALGVRGTRARAAAPALVELLDDKELVTNAPVGTPGWALARKGQVLAIGTLAARALASIGAVEDVYVALSSDGRERARVNAALSLGAIPSAKTVAALQAASASDASEHVRKTASAVLEVLEKGQKVP